MNISTRSLPVEIAEPVTKEDLLKALESPVNVLIAELPNDATGTMVTVCLDNDMDTKNLMILGMRVYVVNPSSGQVAKTVHLGYGLGNLEGFRIPPAGCLDP